MLVGSAPVSSEILTFLKVVLSIPIIESYGQTECGSLTFVSQMDPTNGHVGGPCSLVKMRLKDLPELGYLSSDNPPRGEIQAKSSATILGYYKNPVRTLELFENGWVSTGDVGQVY